MTIPTLSQALELRHRTVEGAGEYATALAVWQRIKSRFKRASDYARLTHGEQLFHDVFFALDSEVDNGGLHQYLSNSSGDDAERVRGHLAEIGAGAAASVLAQVATLFPNGRIPTERPTRLADLEAAERDREDFEELLERADREYALAQPELYARLLDHVEARRDEFALPASP